VKKDERIKQLSKELNDATFYYREGVDDIVAVTVIKYEKYASGGACPETNKSVNEHRKKGGK
jgi:hypothetical protein